MPGITQPSMLSSDHPASLRLDLKVAASGEYIWGSLTLAEHSGRVRRFVLPHTYLDGSILGMPDDMHDLFLAWLFADSTEVIRILKAAVERWQDDCDYEGGHPAHNR